MVTFNACWSTSGALPLIWFNFLSQSQFPLPSLPWQNRSLHATNGYFHSTVLLVWSDTCFRVLICRWQEPDRFEKTIYPHVNTHYSRPAGKCVFWRLVLQWRRVKCWPSMMMWDAGGQKAHTHHDCTALVTHWQMWQRRHMNIYECHFCAFCGLARAVYYQWPDINLHSSLDC